MGAGSLAGFQGPLRQKAGLGTGWNGRKKVIYLLKISIWPKIIKIYKSAISKHLPKPHATFLLSKVLLLCPCSICLKDSLTAYLYQSHPLRSVLLHTTQSIPWKECSSHSKSLVSITNTTDFAFQEEVDNHNWITIKIEDSNRNVWNRKGCKNLK